MLEPYAWIFGDFLTRLITFEAQLQNYAAQNPGGITQQFAFLQATSWAQIIEVKARELALEQVFQKAERIRCLKSPPTASELANDIRELRDRLQDALKSRAFLEVPPNKVNYYDPKLIFGDKVLKKFPKITYDLDEGSKCFALGRDTACVFHLMRAMEHAVQSLGLKLKVPINTKTESWYQILCHVNKQIKPMPEKTENEKAKKARYSSCAAHLDNIRIACRNDVMHPKEQYSESEARDVIEHVSIFFRDLVGLV